MTFALSYSSRQEIVLAARQIAVKFKNGQIGLDQINEAFLSENLMTSQMPDPDLIIRTSGENRLSNFLMWQASYSELFFSPVLWPDFTTADFAKACQNYYQRERRFGKVAFKSEESFL